MSWKLFLDDERTPETSVEDPAFRARSALPRVSPDPLPGTPWTVARSAEQARSLVLERGWPVFVSFDHDLGPDGMSGHDFAWWLVNHDLDGGGMPEDFAYEAHSGNPPGRANIVGLLDNYLQQKSGRGAKP